MTSESLNKRLIETCRNSDIEADSVKQCIDQGADVNVITCDGMNRPVLMECMYATMKRIDRNFENNLSKIRLLLDAGARTDRDEFPQDFNTFGYLFNFNISYGDGEQDQTAVWFHPMQRPPAWVFNRMAQIAKLLINAGLDLDASCNYQGLTPLTISTAISADIVELLLQAGANVNGVDVDGEEGTGETPLASCASFMFPFASDRKGPLYSIDAVLASAELLIRYGADLHKTTRSGFTPLQLAASDGFEAMVSLLIRNGAIR
jgi:ankyrin repeat protein